ncbi:phage tail tape measure protein [bacterium 19MO03SA05]|uniref:Phage tail tape measure protein n=1 Tax=bacterium 19MO03SA05 TaxID=2920620 RepID=A0AAU6VL79_UNCXX
MDDKLLMQIGLIDQITKPLQGITKDIDTAMKTAKSGMQDMVTGGAGVVATGIAIKTALMPAIEINRKIGEVKSLQVADQTLSHLKDTAIGFSMEYGKSAAEFIGASYDIQSAIAGLKNNELSDFTRNSGILAAATKADTATITSYMGTMYGIFEKDAAALGNSNWVERVTGMTAKSVQMFKTDGNKMSQAFSSLGASATTMGVSMAEQMAILGMLQATMGGGESATKFNAFFNGIDQAQKKLGLSFFDSYGKMLPMADVLESIQDRIGHFSNDKQFAILKDAFGSSEAVKLIQLLQDKTEALGASVEVLDKNSSVDTAIEMAKAMTDQWNRLDAAFFALRATVFGAVLPVFESMAKGMADNIGWLVEWLNQYPVLTQWLGYAAIFALSLGGVVASLSLAIGIAKLMSGGWVVTIKILTLVMKVNRLITLAWSAAVMIANGEFALMRVILKGTIVRIWAMTAATRIGKFAILTWSYATKAAQLATIAWTASVTFLGSMLGALRAGIVSMTASAWLFNAALWANPITWVIAGIVALVAVVGAMIYWWDDLKASFGDTAVFKLLADTIDWVINKLNMIPGINIEWRANDMPKAPEMEASKMADSLHRNEFQAMPTFANMQTQLSTEASNVVWLDPQYKNAAPELRNPELTASVNPHIQPMPAFAPMSVPVTPQMGSLDNTIDTQLIDYKRPERAPQLNKNMVNNMTSSHTKETSNIRQFGDVYITTSASSFDEIEERRELDVG